MGNASTTFMVLDYKHEVHKISAVTVNDLFRKADEMGIDILDWEVLEGEDFVAV